MGAAAAVGLQAQGTASQRIPGYYKLAKSVRHGANGEVLSTNTNPVGCIYFDKAGRAFNLIAPAGRHAAKDARNPTLEELKEITTGVMAYFATYTVDEAAQKLTIHIEAAANPVFTGTDIVRAFRLVDNFLILTVPGDNPVDNWFERQPTA